MWFHESNLMHKRPKSKELRIHVKGIRLTQVYMYILISIPAVHSKTYILPDEILSFLQIDRKMQQRNTFPDALSKREGHPQSSSASVSMLNIQKCLNSTHDLELYVGVINWWLNNDIPARDGHQTKQETTGSPTFELIAKSSSIHRNCD